MRTSVKKIILLVVAVGVAAVFYFYWQNLRGVWPLLKPVPDRETVSPLPSEENTSGKPINTTGIPLKLPDGFSIEVFAKDLPGARVMVFDSFDNMWVSQTSEGKVTLLEIQDGKVTNQNAIFRQLRKPHGLAFNPDFPTSLFIAEEHRISQVPTYSDGGLTEVVDLPTEGGGHFTRTLGIGSDKRLYVSIGSSCNVCNEKDSRRAKLFSLNLDGTGFKEFARGLRNAVFFTWHPKTKKMWTTEMGRDLLGDNIPPDEINIVEEGRNYGWPTCYGKNIHDTSFDKNTYVRNPCMEPLETGSHVDLQAHSAPLGLAFIPDSWPREYRDDLLVAYHGSWNRSVPTGYKLVRIKLDENGNYEGTEDFISGWHDGSKVYGRPVDLMFSSDGSLYVSDDRAGLIYRIKPFN